MRDIVTILRVNQHSSIRTLTSKVSASSHLFTNSRKDFKEKEKISIRVGCPY